MFLPQVSTYLLSPVDVNSTEEWLNKALFTNFVLEVFSVLKGFVFPARAHDADNLFISTSADTSFRYFDIIAKFDFGSESF